MLIVEDDVHGRLLSRTVRPLSAFAPDLAVYVTGTAKVLAPGLRVGFIVAPPGLGPRIAAGIRGTTWMAAPLMAEIASRWIQDGTAERILARKRKRRGPTAWPLKAFDHFAMQAHPTRTTCGWPSRGRGRGELRRSARRAGVAVTPASAFAAGRGATPEAVRLCLGAAADKDVLARALGILAGLLTTTPETTESFGP